MMPLAAGVPTPRVRVLVADHAEVMVKTLCVILDLAGYDACALYWGEAAARLLNLFKPDLVVTDVSTPNVATREIEPEAAFALPQCKVLLFTGHTELHSLLGDMSATTPPFELVTRPILPDDLMMKLRQSLCSGQPPVLVPIDMTDTKVH